MLVDIPYINRLYSRFFYVDKKQYLLDCFDVLIKPNIFVLKIDSFMFFLLHEQVEVIRRYRYNEYLIVNERLYDFSLIRKRFFLRSHYVNRMVRKQFVRMNRSKIRFIVQVNFFKSLFKHSIVICIISGLMNPDLKLILNPGSLISLNNNILSKILQSII